MADRHHEDVHRESDEDDDDMLDMDEAEEVVEQEDDAAMDSGDDDQMDEEIQLQNDSAAHFDHHKSSIFCIAQHPTRPEIIATGGGDDIGYIWDCTPSEGPVLPASYESNPQPQERKGLAILARLEGQDESVNSVCFTQPKGEYVVTATLAGKLNVYTTPSDSAPSRLVGSAKEVEEINWLSPCPGAANANTIAFGASDGSVWVYRIDASDSTSPLTIVQTFFLHQAPCTAGAWTPDGKLLATVDEESSLYVMDVFGEAAAAGIVNPSGGQAIIGLTAADERFRVDGGLYSVAISPGGGIVAVGGAEGNVRIVGLPRLAASSSQPAGKGVAARGKSNASKSSTPAAAAGQAGQILASLKAQTDGVETLDFSQPPLTLLAAGSVDGSITIFDAAHNFAVRRNIGDAHEEEAVIKVEFVKTPLGTANERGHILTSCGNDGVVRRWDVRGGTAAVNKGFAGEWKGHRGGGDGGGILGFVQGGGGSRVITAGDDSVALVFETK
jgi:ribosome assembly protein SQT1